MAHGYSGSVLAVMGTPCMAVASAGGHVQFLMLPGESGQVEKFAVPQATGKSAVRFAVGAPGHRGTVWRLWASPKTDDVYLASRHTAGEANISLHQSGDWRMQIVNPKRPKTAHFHDVDGGRNGRVLDRWPRPASNAVGWTHALSIVLPEHHLATIPDDRNQWEDVRWCPAPATGEHVEFQVHIATPGKGAVGYRDLLESGCRLAVMDVLRLTSDNVVIVLAVTASTTPLEASAITRYELHARSSLPPEGEFDRSPELAPRHQFSVPAHEASAATTTSPSPHRSPPRRLLAPESTKPATSDEVVCDRSVWKRGQGRQFPLTLEGDTR